ncbi:MAG: DUF624 domain-containing protein [Oscillospiraceae bacterium]|nr:DUF624 domain-containing protein [Oscillospiraceae bacterium]
MRGLFNYESKIMQYFLALADIFILNIVFLLCCIPLFTIGAAQTGLYCGIRRLLDPEDDRSCLGAFFKGFANGFKHITLVHMLYLLVIVLVVWSTLAASALSGLEGFTSTIPVPPGWLCILALCICALFHSTLAPFHANFNCTTKQLLRNSFFVAFAYPIHAVGITALIWAPVAVFLWNTYYFLLLIPVWGTLYYSLAYMLAFYIMKKPMKELTQDFLASQKAEAAPDFPVEISEHAEHTK